MVPVLVWCSPLRPEKSLEYHSPLSRNIYRIRFCPFQDSKVLHFFLPGLVVVENIRFIGIHVPSVSGVPGGRDFDRRIRGWGGVFGPEQDSVPVRVPVPVGRLPRLPYVTTLASSLRPNPSPCRLSSLVGRF